MKTREVNTRIVILLGVVFCMALFQIEASAIFVPDGGVTIVLRAPTSENPQIIKISQDRNGNYKQEVIQSLGVYLPKKTPVFFRVDQVNTALYDVNITVKELGKKETEEQNVLPLPQFAEILSFLEEAIGKLQSGTASISSSESNLLETPNSDLQAVEKKLQAVKDLNSKLNELLYMSEKPGFSDFKSIKSDAINAVKESGLGNGTSEEFCAKAEEIIKEIHEVLDTVKASIKNSGNPDDKFASLLKDLGDASKIKKAVSDIFAHTAKKLRRIETASR